MRARVNKEMRCILKNVYFTVAIMFLSGCQWLYEPSYTLGRAIEKETLGEQLTKKDILKKYGQLVVPCENTQNVCYLHADIKRMKLDNSQLVEFVIDDHNQLEYIIYRSR